jgi:hypothetical protein
VKINPINYKVEMAKLRESKIDPLNIISELQNLNLELCGDNLIFSLINRLGKFGMIETIIKAGNHSFIERARINYNGEVFQKFEDISYNFSPSNNYKRCTIPGEIVFYGTLPIPEIEQVRLPAVTETTEILENDSNEILEERMTVVRWQVKKDLRCVAIIGKEEFLDHNRNLVNTRDSLYMFIKNHQNPEEVKSTFKINEFLGQEFGKKVNDNENHNYKISAIFSDLVFKQGFDGIIYPAVSLGGAGLNIALRKEVIDNKYLEPILAIQIHNYSLGKNFISDNPYSGVYLEDKIKWNDTPYSGYVGRANCIRELYKNI